MLGGALESVGKGTEAKPRLVSTCLPHYTVALVSQYLWACWDWALRFLPWGREGGGRAFLQHFFSF